MLPQIISNLPMIRARTGPGTIHHLLSALARNHNIQLNLLTGTLPDINTCIYYARMFGISEGYIKTMWIKEAMGIIEEYLQIKLELE